MTERTKTVAPVRRGRREKATKVSSRRYSRRRFGPANNVLQLQRTLGNQAVLRMARAGVLQAKLRIGRPNDVYEREADMVADRVLSMPEPRVQRQSELEEEEELQMKPLADQITPLVQRQPAGEEEEEEELQMTPQVQKQPAGEEEEEEEELQMKPLVQKQPAEEEEEEEELQMKPLVQRQPTGEEEEEEEELQLKPLVQRQFPEEEEEEELQAKGNPGRDLETGPDLESSIQAVRGGGRPLPEACRNFYEPRFGYDFGSVRIHTDSGAADVARRINAKAFTVGSDIFFGTGQHPPTGREDRRLMAHELTHVVQQNSLLQKKIQR